MKPESKYVFKVDPLFEGKKILYKVALEETDSILDKLHQTCALIIEKRENYLNEEAFTGLVDRFLLVN